MGIFIYIQLPILIFSQWSTSLLPVTYIYSWIYVYSYIQIYAYSHAYFQVVAHATYAPHAHGSTLHCRNLSPEKRNLGATKP